MVRLSPHCPNQWTSPICSVMPITCKSIQTVALQCHVDSNWFDKIFIHSHAAIDFSWHWVLRLPKTLWSSKQWRFLPGFLASVPPPSPSTTPFSALLRLRISVLKQLPFQKLLPLRTAAVDSCSGRAQWFLSLLRVRLLFSFSSSLIRRSVTILMFTIGAYCVIFLFTLFTFFCIGLAPDWLHYRWSWAALELDFLVLISKLYCCLEWLFGKIYVTWSRH